MSDSANTKKRSCYCLPVTLGVLVVLYLAFNMFQSYRLSRTEQYYERCINNKVPELNCRIMLLEMKVRVLE